MTKIKSFISIVLTTFLLVLIFNCQTSPSDSGSNNKNTNLKAPYIQGVLQREKNDWGTIIINNRYILNNDVWNKGGTIGDYLQEVFNGNFNGSDFIGWDWQWSGGTGVVAYPNVLYGDSPWFGNFGIITEFPYQVGTKSLTVNFNVDITASGVYNMSFDIWALSDLPSVEGNISHEIMIWNINKASNDWSWLTKLGTTIIDGVTFDVYERLNHSGDPNGLKKWTYIAFVSQTNVIQASWHIDTFINYLISKGVMSTSNYISNIEFGNEVTNGTGIVKITDYSVTVN